MKLCCVKTVHEDYGIERFHNIKNANGIAYIECNNPECYEIVKVTLGKDGKLVIEDIEEETQCCEHCGKRYLESEMKTIVEGQCEDEREDHIYCYICIDEWETEAEMRRMYYESYRW